MIDRRHFSLGFGTLIGGSALLLAGCRGGGGNVIDSANAMEPTGNGVDPDMNPAVRFAEVMRDIERKSGGRLGIAMIDTATATRLAWRGGERFLMCSSFKLILAAATLARVDDGREGLDRSIMIARSAIVAHSPVTAKAVGKTMTVAELCEATITTSDNAAANLLLEGVGGPAGLTAWIRSTGDSVTRCDRMEPMLNDTAPGDQRDTTSPDAMAASLERLLTGKVLSPTSRDRLIRWLVANTTGARRIRAGTPDGWRVGDKTGTSGVGTTADIGILWPPSGKPVLLAIYLTETTDTAEASEAVLADATRASLGFIA